MDKISAVVITKNEERNIRRCLLSLQGVADEVVVVDSGSTDNTEKICREEGALFTFNEWLGFSEQKNYANSLASNPWILSIDADEALSPELRDNIIKLKNNGFDPDCIYIVNRLNNYCGKWVYHCGWYPDHCTRLWKKDAAQWEGVVHESLRHKPNMKRQLINGDLLHYTYYEISEHARKTQQYSILSAEKAFQNGHKGSFANIILKPIWTFISSYILRGGFLDGKMGFIICRMSANYTFIKYSHLYELSTKKKEQ